MNAVKDRTVEEKLRLVERLTVVIARAEIVRTQLLAEVGADLPQRQALVRDTIAETIGAKDGLQTHIGDREMLLVVDNLEQLIDSAPELATARRRLSESPSALHFTRAAAGAG